MKTFFLLVPLLFLIGCCCAQPCPPIEDGAQPAPPTEKPEVIEFTSDRSFLLVKVDYEMDSSLFRVKAVAVRPGPDADLTALDATPSIDTANARVWTVGEMNLGKLFGRKAQATPLIDDDTASEAGNVEGLNSEPSMGVSIEGARLLQAEGAFTFKVSGHISGDAGALWRGFATIQGPPSRTYLVELPQRVRAARSK